MKRALVLLLVALCAAVVWFATSRRDASPSVIPEPTPPTIAPSAPAAKLDDVARPVEQARAAIAAEHVVVAAPPAATPAQRDDDSATLHVLVRARETGLPAPDVRVLAVRSRTYMASSSDDSVGRVGELLLTDDDGRVTIYAAPLGELIVIVQEEGAVELMRVDVEPALAAGETRELMIPVPTQPDRTFCARVVDAETQQPIAGATISIGGDLYDDPAEGAVATDFAGIACLALRSWSPHPLVARAPGRAPLWVYATRARERGDPFVVALARTAAVTIRALDASGAPRVGLRVQLAASPTGLALGEAGGFGSAVAWRAGPTWDSTAGDDGTARLAELPANVELVGTCWVRGFDSQRVPESIVLRPGEERVVEWRAGSACALHGRAVDASGAAVQDVRIALEPSDWVGGAYFGAYDSTDRRHAKTDTDGRFAFDDVPAGAWLVGPAPASAGSSARPPYAPFGQRVEIAAGVARVDVVVELDAGGMITGRVLDTDGELVDEGSVLYTAVDGHAEESESAYGGRFELGPFRSGEYELRAHGGDAAKGAYSETVRVRAGGPPVDLRLRAPGRIRGRVLDATTREPVAAVVLLNLERSEPMRIASREQTANGSFELPKLIPGTYVVTARTSDGRYGASASVALLAGQTIDDVEVLVRPGGRLKLELDGLGEETFLMLVRDDWTLSFDPVDNGFDDEIPVPLGRVTVRLWDVMTRANHDVEVDVRAGETRALVFDGAWK